MSRIAAQTAADFQFRSGDNVPTRTQKLELLRRQLITTTQAANYTALSYIIADGLQAINTPLFPNELPALENGAEVEVENDSKGIRHNVSMVFGTRDWLPVGSERTFRGSYRARLITDGSEPGTLSVGFLIYSSGGIYLGDLNETVADGTWLVSDGAIDAVVDTTSAGIMAAYPTASYVRSFVFPQCFGGTYVINRPRIEDLTAPAGAEAALAAAEAASAAALASATAAFGSQTTAAGFATVATSQASIATGQASAALASAVAAQSYADDADTFATASSVSASAAATSATSAGSSASAANTSALNAATQATNAAGSASAANTSASTAAASSTAAGNSASAANTSAINAATQAGNASGSASAAATSATSASASSTAAGNSATAANTSAIAAAASNASATTQAGISTTQAAAATAASASAAASAVLSASITPNSRTKDPYFNLWTTTSDATEWVAWVGAEATRVAGFQSQYSANLIGSAGGNGGQQQAIHFSPGWWVEEMEVTLNSGTLRGVGMHTHSYTGTLGAGTSTGDFSTTDFWSRYGDGVAGRTYKIGVLREWTVPCLSALQYAMAHWNGFVGTGGDISAANDITVRYCGIRMATEAEIRDQTVLAPLQATVASEQSARVDLTTKMAEARLRILVAASGGNPAILEMYSATGATSFLRLGADQIYFGGNTIFYDASDVLESITGSVVNSIAWGAAFGASSDLLQWVGPTGIALASRTKANAYFYISTTAPRIGGSEVATPALPAGTISLNAVIMGVICDVPSSGTAEVVKSTTTETIPPNGSLRIKSRGYNVTETTIAVNVRIRVKITNNGVTTTVLDITESIADFSLHDALNEAVTIVANPVTLAGTSTVEVTATRSGAAGESGEIWADFEIERIAP